MRIIVVGFGSIAKRHIKNLKKIDPSIAIALWRRRNRKDDLGDTAPLIDNIFCDEKEVLQWNPEAALITSPASQHIKTAFGLAKNGAHLFIEKPLSNSLLGTQELIKLSSRKSLTLMVGYNFHFYAPLQKIKEALDGGAIGKLLSIRAEIGQYLPNWRPETNYRTSVSAQKELGGGVLFELSHELDYIRWLAGDIESISSVSGKLSPLEIDVEDTAAIIFRLKSGAIGSLHLDMTDLARKRHCRLVGTKGTLIIDLLQHQVKLWSPSGKGWEIIYSGDNYDTNSMYIEELTHFLQCIRLNKPPKISGTDGQRTLELILKAKQSSI